MQKKFIINYFTKAEKYLWSISVILILSSFFAFEQEKVLMLTASLIGVTSLIFIAKGNPVGQMLTIIFSVIYGIISYSFSYYGEMITYLGMTAPMACLALVSWLKNPFDKNRSEVKIKELKKSEIILVFILTAIITFAFYFILKAFNTANLIPSTISVATSFMAVSLLFLRSSYYAVAYALNDVVLIILWSYAVIEDISYISVLICFVVFLANDIYGFYNWSKMKKRQNEISS